MADNSQTPEPSMEEILASIRRIISEDGATVEPTKTEEGVTAEPAKAEPVVAPAAASVEEVPVLDLIDEVQDDGSVAPVEEPAPPMPEPEPAPTVSIPVDSDRLISDTAAQASAQALSGLSRLMGGTMNISSQPIGEGHKTLESMVLELLRPILKDWLDRNLPVMVERIVQKEIQKITRDLN